MAAGIGLLLAGAAAVAIAALASKAGAAQQGGGGAGLGADGFEANMPDAYKQHAAIVLTQVSDADAVDKTAAVFDSFGFHTTAARMRQRAAQIRAGGQQSPPIVPPVVTQPPAPPIGQPPAQPPTTIPGTNIPLPIPPGFPFPVPPIPTVPPPPPPPPPPPTTTQPPIPLPPIPGIPPGTTVPPFPPFPIPPGTIPGLPPLPGQPPPVAAPPTQEALKLPPGGYIKGEDGALVPYYVLQPKGDSGGMGPISEKRFGKKPGAAYAKSWVRENTWVKDWTKLQPGQELAIPKDVWTPPPGVVLMPTPRPGPPDPYAGKGGPAAGKAKASPKPPAAKPPARPPSQRNA